MTGTVYLVGAGPGDPGLITIAGRDALARADVVFYDRLTHPSLLDHAPAEAERFFVGKESARHHVSQHDTNALMASHALAGRTVVRLKGGDPMVFGRGGEEAEYLRELGVPFVFVPGVTSAIAALAYAGIPITHRDAASSFAVVTGHERDDQRESGTRPAGEGEQRRRWDRIAHAADTLVFLMGVENLEKIRSQLIAHGRSADTPVALVQWGTWNRQRTVSGTLANIVDLVRAEGITAPAVTVVGDVVRWRDRLRWFDTRPLHGRRVVVTRAREQSSELSGRLREQGAEVIEHPVFAIAPPEDNGAAMRATINRLSEFDWVCFTSSNAVEAFFEELSKCALDARALSGIRFGVVGDATNAALVRCGIRPDFQPTRPVAEALADQLTDEFGRRILFPASAGAGSDLPEGLHSRGFSVTVVEAYRQLRLDRGSEELSARFRSGDIDAVAFASSNTVRWFSESISPVDVPASTRLVAIGPKTAEACRQYLRSPDRIADNATVESLTEAVLEAVGTV